MTTHAKHSIRRTPASGPAWDRWRTFWLPRDSDSGTFDAEFRAQLAHTPSAVIARRLTYWSYRLTDGDTLTITRAREHAT